MAGIERPRSSAVHVSRTRQLTLLLWEGSKSVVAQWMQQTQAFYASRGIGTRSGLGQCPAVIVVDMTRAFTDPDHPVGSDQTSSLLEIRRVLDAARAKHVPIFYTTLAFQEGARDAPAWARKMPALETLRTTDEAAMEIDVGIAPHTDDVVLNKTAPSAFFGTGLISMLIPLRVDTLIITGCATSGCVRATVIDAISYGFRIALPRGCVSDRAEGPHEANLFDMDAKYADVIPTDEVVGYLASLDTRTGDPVLMKGAEQ